MSLPISLAIYDQAKQLNQTLCVITPDSLTAHQLERELSFLLPSSIAVFPGWETLPYDLFAPHPNLISKRLSLLNQLSQGKKQIIIISIPTLMSPVPPKDYITQHTLLLSIHQILSLETFRSTLIQNGYRMVSQVMEHGECAIRGSILDLYPMGSEFPYRIDLLDDEIDSIRTFDPDSQRSIASVPCIHLLPAHEFSFSETSIQQFRKNWREQFPGNPNRSLLYQSVSQGHYSAGLEYYLPLFSGTKENFFSYLPKDVSLILLQDIHTAAQQFWNEIHERYQSFQHDIERPLLPPAELFLSPDTVTQTVSSFPILECPSVSNLLPDLAVEWHTQKPLQKLDAFLTESASMPILFCCESLGRRERLFDLLKTIHRFPKTLSSWDDFTSSEPGIYSLIAPFHSGLLQPSPAFCVITETELFGQRTPQHSWPNEKKTAQEYQSAIQNLLELKIGDLIVHVDHGIGRYLGLQLLTVGDTTDEYVTILYANDNKLYVPVSSLYRIHRYNGAPTESVSLHSLGTDRWIKTKQKAQEKIRDTATQLLHLYARRSIQKSFHFSKPHSEYLTFEESFPFEETADQTKAIQDTLQDMCSDKIMDRLICGDVGFGKTEVAMRAAFIAVQNHKQVAILVPTTLLAQQHFDTFSNRFAAYAITIEMISRFRSEKEQKMILEKLKTGKIDIIIGTHKLLQPSVHFQELGLLIIDEEHRFGVRQKEQLKKIRADVDTLALTATPIPRTLNMALASIRDLSIIATPPMDRLSIKTFIYEKQDHIVREAMLREILRGGQVYYLYNDVASIHRCAVYLEKLIPEAKIQVAHGQMPERDLEQVMADFYHHRFSVLVCSTIIESGIDIPSANTMIIERADKFGLAQLHQLRGRVGRSAHQAYAYLLIPPQEALSSDALKRLEAIVASDNLGIGFTLATYDLEIRGAGALLGEEQSGHIEEIGFTLYMEMLERTVKSMKNGKIPEFDRLLDPPVEIHLKQCAIIPETYLPDVHTRLVFYKRIAQAKNSEELSDLRVEMIDRFGLLPLPLQVLFEHAELRLLAEKIGIRKIEGTTSTLKILFNEKNQVDAEKILQLIKHQPDRYQLKGSLSLQCQLDSQEPVVLHEFLSTLFTPPG